MSGDTFDKIALRMMGDEMKAPELILANIGYAHVVVFGAGITLQIPSVLNTTPINLPPWKR